jgi:hypothetical protein
MNRTWHRGTKAKIKSVLQLIETLKGDVSEFMKRLQEIETLAFGKK